MEKKLSQVIDVEATARKRKVWIDWMKAIGIFTIVWGHCFPEGMNEFIYAFNVPVFFAISGYLTRRESSMRVCFDKCFHNLIIPYFMLAFIKCAGTIIKHFGDGQYVWSLIGIFGGFHSIHGVTGCNNLWFVYTLILIKLLYQLLPSDRISNWCLVGASIIGTLAYNHFGLEWTWAVTNTFLALPFFLLGNMLAPKTPLLARCSSLFTPRKAIPLALIMALAVWVIGYYNGAAYLFQGQYGNNLILFAVGAIIGSTMIFLISMLLDHKDWRTVRIISSGTIVILVFHRELLHPILKAISKQDLGIVAENVLLFLAAGAVVLAFVPIILILKRFFPIVLGRRAKNI